MFKKALVILMLPFFSYANELSVEQAKKMHEELNTDMRIMQEKMHTGMMSNDPDVAFAAGMLPHHLGAVEMVEIELKYGKNPEMIKLAKNIILEQKKEIKEMQEWLKENKK
ncbi:TPA: DUF305 domain-containing protein [Escherichia albertii]|uniref:CopM family metallochaperone n=1 Tax=Escherichia albertii TaxID=208962 RepID=UPI001DF393FE|nr:DUF305 domain-containing protein [Escherichia albertii]WKU81577.1 DUF305 domain-containing protein [Escherichia albertii]HAX3204441.1 DUF305 domain-containing protein [Escherichia albertii]